MLRSKTHHPDSVRGAESKSVSEWWRIHAAHRDPRFVCSHLRPVTARSCFVLRLFATCDKNNPHCVAGDCQQGPCPPWLDWWVRFAHLSRNPQACHSAPPRQCCNPKPLYRSDSWAEQAIMDCRYKDPNRFTQTTIALHHRPPPVLLYSFLCALEKNRGHQSRSTAWK
jgi:hypothetical protein